MRRTFESWGTGAKDRISQAIAVLLALVVAITLGSCSLSGELSGNVNASSASSANVSVNKNATGTSSTSNSSSANPSATTTQYKFRTTTLLNEHYEKHGKDMGFASAADYQAAASDVVTNSASLHKTEKEDGDDVYYLEATNDFVIVSTDGYIRTYFRPDSGIAYFNRQ